MVEVWTKSPMSEALQVCCFFWSLWLTVLNEIQYDEKWRTAFYCDHGGKESVLGITGCLFDFSFVVLEWIGLACRALPVQLNALFIYSQKCLERLCIKTTPWKVLPEQAPSSPMTLLKEAWQENFLKNLQRLQPPFVDYDILDVRAPKWSGLS